MFRATTSQQSTQTHVAVSAMTSARGMEPVDYVLPSRAEFEKALVARLDRLITAGATDVETIAVLDEELRAIERVEHADLETQRVAHVRTCKAILDVAQKNATEARDLLQRADETLERANTALQAHEAALEARNRDRVQQA